MPFLDLDRENVAKTFDTELETPVGSVRNLKLRLENRFGAEPSSAPLILNHSIGKFAFSFPHLYLKGAYPVSIHAQSDPDLEHMFIAHLPDRAGIKDISSYFPDRKSKGLFSADDVIRNLKLYESKNAERDHAAIGAAKAPLVHDRIISYLEKVGKSRSVADSTLARLILGSTRLIDSKTMDNWLLESWQMFVHEYKKHSSDHYFLLIPNKWGSDQWLLSKLPLDQVKWTGILVLTEADQIDITQIPLKGINHLVTVDDAIYSGIQKADMILSIRNEFGQLEPKQSLFGFGELFGFGRESETLMPAFGGRENELPKSTPKLQFDFVIPIATRSGQENMKEQISPQDPISVRFYPVVELHSIEDLVNCQKPYLEKIVTLGQAQESMKPFQKSKQCLTIEPWR